MLSALCSLLSAAHLPLLTFRRSYAWYICFA
jgi:hypothetical protein